MERCMTRFYVALLACCMMTLTGCQKTKSNVNCFDPIKEVAYEDSMGKSATEFNFIFANGDDAARYAKTKALYEKNLPSKVERSRETKIPKIIHQIWLGPKMPPNYFYVFQEKWKNLHPGWEYKLWNEEELEKLHLENWSLVEKSTNWAEKSDIIRADLLCRFGGMYVDDDLEPLHSFDELHEKYDFYAGMEPPHKIATTSNRVWVGISIMASRPGHPIMKNWQKRIRECWDDVDARYSSQIERVINHTYFNFTRAVLDEMDAKGNVDMIFPATYFYPISASYAANRRSSCNALKEKLYDILENLHLKRPRAYSRSYPETLGIHYWGNTWLPSAAEQTKDMQRMIDSARSDLYKMKSRVRALENQVSLLQQLSLTNKEPAPVLEAGQ